jgi:hypothetical protein
MKDYKELDSLLKTSLSCEEKPSQYLNEKLKINLKENVSAKKEISIWWMPMIMSIISGLMIFIGIRLFIDAYFIKIILQCLCFVVVILNILITFIGVKYFDLRKGAVINI